MTQSDASWTDPMSGHGWKARLSVRLKPVAGQTRVIRQQHVGPLRVQRAFYPEGEICHLYLLHPPGGVVGSDSLSTNVTVAPGAKSLLTMPGAAKLYRSNGATAEIAQYFSLGTDSQLEWLPPISICFSGCKSRIKSEFRLSVGARLIAWETFCFGRPVMGEKFSTGSVQTSLRIWCDEQLILNEVLRVIDGLTTTAGFPLHSTVVLTPASGALRDQIRTMLVKRKNPAGATLFDALLIVRLLDDDNLQLEADLLQIWRLARQQIMGKNVSVPRIWST